MRENMQKMEPKTSVKKHKRRYKGIIISGIVLGVILLVILIISSVILYNSLNGKKDFSQINVTSDKDNYVSLRDGVVIEENVDNIKKNFVSMTEEKGVYVLTYRRQLPDMFRNLSKGNIFCVYPGKSETKSYFAMGFSGKFISASKEKNRYIVKFTMPDFKEVFSDINIDTNKISIDNQKTVFVPEDNVEIKEIKKSKISLPFNPALMATKVKDEITIGDNTAGFEFRNTGKKSLLSDYKLLCDSLKLSIKNKNEGGDVDTTFSGDITFDEPAIKYVLDYHYDEKNDNVKINKFDMGFITKQKVELAIKADKEITLEDLKFKKKSSNHIIEIDDVTDSEKGKMVLGTYIVGFNVNVYNPITGKKILQNSKNKVSYLSLGIAFQLTLTAKGEIELECKYEETGFLRVEVNSQGKNSVISRAYDYPNPVTNTAKPTQEQKISKPELSMEVKGKIGADIAIGADAGVCIFGLIPIKLAINCPEAEMESGFKIKSENKTESPDEIIKDSYILSDDVDYLMVSINGKMKMHLGAKVNLGEIKKYTLAEGGVELQAFKNVILQYPKPKMFSHEECGFGGIYINETYDDTKLKKDYQEFTDKFCKKSDGLVDDIKKHTFKSLTDNISSELGYGVENIIKGLGIDVDSYKTDFYDGVIYLRDSSDKVIAEIVTNQEIINKTGVHNGLEKKKIEQIYSAPNDAFSTEVKIGTFMRLYLGIDNISDMNLSQYTYYSKDSNERMDLVFDDKTLKLIVVSVR